METHLEPHRCPKCQALVVDRRFPNCTTCRTELPKEWIMSRDQAAKLKAIDQDAQREYAESMEKWNRVKSSSEYPTTLF